MAERQIGCGELNGESLAVVNFRPLEDLNSRTSGEVVTIEFVPANFKFMK
jgi:hypothetical protein